MRLATLRNGTRDGALIVVSRDGQAYAPAARVAPTLQAALDDWDHARVGLADLAAALDARTGDGGGDKDSGDSDSGGDGDGDGTGDRDSGGTAGAGVQPQPLDPAALSSPLPRAFEWIDGSAFLNHVVLVRQARGAEPPETLGSDPLVYQGGSGVLLGPTDDIPLADPQWGLDFESEICVVLGDTPRGTRRAEAGRHVRLLMLANDLTLRNLVPAELAKGFGFLVSKPATAFSPFAVTPDELGPAWQDGRVHLRLRTTYNRELVGDVDAGPEMHFSFFDLIEHVARTRSLTAGTILGSGTVSNADPARGISCLAERRARETIATGRPATPFMQAGDTVSIEMLDAGGRSVFGRIAQKVVAA